MGRMTFQEFSMKNKIKVEFALSQALKELSSPNDLLAAMNYSLQAGGKRLRPLLLFATLKGFNKEMELGLPVATAIEMIHTYSLIHDDLPSMDNDDLRRGKPTNHKVYGEALAILAGDALLTYSFQVMAEMQHSAITDEMKIRLIRELAIASGPEGMVGGQVADMQGENQELRLEEMEYIHTRKTGKLLSFSVVAGAILSNATPEQYLNLKKFSEHLGLAFQIRDDILDIEGTEAEIGKPVGSDQGNMKSTYPSVLTLDGAKQKLSEHIHFAKQHLYDCQIMHDYLEEICELIATRTH
ncbi:polyprenyl synthetase family protein [Bacillus salitolerans]|uniref:Polyprenyl synthetase family protein n=1 Tax=Bacillus salitolerans TaxID=1437434 RepID=A0ABW4LNC7_9BACI